MGLSGHLAQTHDTTPAFAGRDGSGCFRMPLTQVKAAVPLEFNLQ